MNVLSAKQRSSDTPLLMFLLSDADVEKINSGVGALISLYDLKTHVILMPAEVETVVMMGWLLCAHQKFPESDIETLPLTKECFTFARENNGAVLPVGTMEGPLSKFEVRVYVHGNEPGDFEKFCMDKWGHDPSETAMQVSLDELAKGEGDE